jgi:5-methylcytosine-specific restriction endonuclease McrA
LSDEWTIGRRNSFITSVLRAGSRRWPPKYETLREAATEKKINPKTGRLAQLYLCATCCGEWSSKDVQVDHISPIILPTGFTTWDMYIERLFCDKDNMQVLCISCHKVKTQEEKELRKQYGNY